MIKKLLQYIQQKREGRILMRELRHSWQAHNKHVADLPFPSDDDLLDIIQHTQALPASPLSELPSQLVPYGTMRRRSIGGIVLNTIPIAATAAVLLLFVLPMPASYAMNLGADSVKTIDSINIMLPT